MKTQAPARVNPVNVYSQPYLQYNIVLCANCAASDVLHGLAVFVIRAAAGICCEDCGVCNER